MRWTNSGLALFAAGLWLAPDPVRAQQVATGDVGGLPPVVGTASGSGNPEFGASLPPATGSAPNPGPATTKRESKIHQLIREARSKSGREDPFRSLLRDKTIPIAPIPAPIILKPKLTPPPVIVPPPGKVARTLRRPGPGGQYIEEIVYLDPDEPLWELQGILNTGREALAVLELDGLTREARIGEILEDGSKVVSINSAQVVLLSRGRRFVKNIGGQTTP
ncbi:MAG: hypothetical protein VKO64_10530 [Candidatus Sericytochromatia bacterium]|nr:hypothetical protein [Candidatus Sericytochromatia bacterium]